MAHAFNSSTQEAERKEKKEKHLFCVNGYFAMGACVCTPLCVLCGRGQKRALNPPGTEVSDGSGCWELNLDP